MNGQRTERVGWVLAVLGAAGLALAGCSDRGAPEAATTTGATSPPVVDTGECADGRAAAPTPLGDASGEATVVDVIARPTGHIVAVGTSIWIRDPGASTWRSAPAPGTPALTPSAAAEADGEVWVAGTDVTSQQPTLFRSSDLVTWVAVPVVLGDGLTSTTMINALVRDAGRWLALAQDADSVRLISSADAQQWVTEATLPLVSDGGTRALFDLALLPEGPTSVGFTVNEVLRPLVVEWARDGTVTERTIQGDAMAGVRLWGLAALADGRVLVAADRVSFASRAEATGFALVLYERTAAGDLDLVVEPPPVAAYAAPIDLVEAEDGELVVVGSVGGTRETLVPAAWAVCLR